MNINTPPSEFIEAKQAAIERIAAGMPAPEAPTALTYSDIEVIPELFQQRRIHPDESKEHMQTLARAIKRGPRGARQESLTPITIYWVGDAWACVDGHHRLMAYHWVEHPTPVPVTALVGVSLDEAIRASLGDNSKDKKELSKRCKTEAAWRFTLAGGMSKADISALADVDESTVAAMRKTRREFQEENPSADPATIAWATMRHWRLQMDDSAEVKDAEQRAAAKLLRLTEKHLKGASPRVIFLALGMHSPGLMAELLKIHAAHSESEAYRANPFPHVGNEEMERSEF